MLLLSFDIIAQNDFEKYYFGISINIDADEVSELYDLYLILRKEDKYLLSTNMSKTEFKM